MRILSDVSYDPLTGLLSDANGVLGTKSAIMLLGKRINLGYFPSAEAASSAYILAKSRIHNQEARYAKVKPTEVEIPSRLQQALGSEGVRS